MYSKQSKRKNMIRMYGVKRTIVKTLTPAESVELVEKLQQVQATKVEEKSPSFFQRVKNWFK